MKYFDYAATTPIDETVYEVYKQTGESCFFNSGCNKQAKDLEMEARGRILQALDVDCELYDLVFTSGGTEANNLAILGFAKTLSKPGHFITSCFEHASVNSCFVELENQGHRVSYIPVNKQGYIDPELVLQLICQDTVFVSIMLVNNELGTRQPIEQLFANVKAISQDIITMTDYVQGLGKLEFDHRHTDLFTISSHKIYGPKGVGALIKTKKTPIAPLIVGGTNEYNLRAGLQSLPAQVAFATSVEKVIANFTDYTNRIYAVQSYFNNLINNSKQLYLNCTPDGNVSSIRINCNLENTQVIELMEQRGFFLSAKSADSAGVKLYSRSLLGIGLTHEQIDHSMRVSFSHHTTLFDVLDLVNNLQQIAKTN